MGVTKRQSRYGGILLYLCFLALCRAAWADSVVVVNEIMYHPTGNAPEWIELYNQMGDRHRHVGLVAPRRCEVLVP